MRRARPAFANALLAAAFAGVTLLGHAPASQARTVDRDGTIAPSDAQVPNSLEGARYVAIGSSYAAGPQLPPAKPGAPMRCGQSLSNYPTIVAERFGMVLVDRSCSGATTENVLGTWAEIPPQIAAVDAETRLVTVTIGGNDLSYVGNLFSATCAFNAARVVSTAGAKARACGAVRVPNEADYVRDEAQLNEIARRIRLAAPHARLVFVQYPMPLPRAGSLCTVTPISEEHAAIVREIGRRLAIITARVAAAHGALVVEMDQASANHSPCDAEPWMIGAPQNYDGRQGLQWHLNKAGMAATADGITASLMREGLRPARPAVAVGPGANAGQAAPPALAPGASPVAPVTPPASEPVPAPSDRPT